MTLRTFALIALTVLLVAAVRTQEVDPVVREKLRGLNDQDHETRYKAFKEARQLRTDTIQILLAAAGMQENGKIADGLRYPAIELLGEYRADDPVVLKFLLDNILYKPDGMANFEYTRLSGYPCAMALRHIGLPAVREILPRLDLERTDKELELFTGIIQEIDGLDIARFRLRNLLKESGNHPVVLRNVEKMFAHFPKD